MTGGRDEQRLRQTVKTTEATPLRRFDQQPVPRMPLSTYAKCIDSLADNQQGNFRLYRNRPGQLEEGDTVRRAYACGSISAGSKCLLHRCSGENSGGYWVAVSCQPGETPNVPCALFESGTFVQPRLWVEGLVDTSADAFNGWAADANGDHTLEIIAGTAGNINADVSRQTGISTELLCTARVKIATLDNGLKVSSRFRPIGLLEIYVDFGGVFGATAAQQNAGTLTLDFSAGGGGTDNQPGTTIGIVGATEPNADRGTAYLFYSEDPATPYPRTSLKYQDEQTYSTWQRPPSGRYTGLLEDFRVWLANGTFRIYP